MNKTEHLLTILSEECAEVAQRASKAIRFGLSEVQPGQPEDNDNKRRLERELGDLMGVAKLLGLQVQEEDVAAKIEKFNKYMTYAESIGTLERAICEVQVNCHGGRCGKLLPCENHPPKCICGAGYHSSCEVHGP